MAHQYMPKIFHGPHKHLSFPYIINVQSLKSLKPIKAHGAHNISIRMIQLWGDSITLPLTLIFKFSLRNGIFPDTWKMANIIPVHKKEEENIVKNYRPIGLLPIFAKVFESLLLNFLFAHFHDTIYLLNVNLVSRQMIHLYPNVFPKYTKFNYHLIVIHWLMLDLYS